MVIFCAETLHRFSKKKDTVSYPVSVATKTEFIEIVYLFHVHFPFISVN